MPRFKMNQDMTYNVSPIVEDNVFLTMKAENEPVPRYEEIVHLLPAPIWEGRGDVIDCYDYA